MPIEINELIIRAQVSNEPQPAQRLQPVTDNTLLMQRMLDELLQKLENKEER